MTEPIEGQSLRVAKNLAPTGIWSMPLKIRCVPNSWTLLPCVIERTIAYLSAHLARNGMCWEISMPGTLVFIGRDSPRYSAGEFGFRSQMSWCAGAPVMNTRITDLAFGPPTVGRPVAAAL